MNKPHSKVRDHDDSKLHSDLLFDLCEEEASRVARSFYLSAEVEAVIRGTLFSTARDAYKLGHAEGRRVPPDECNGFAG